MPVRSRRPVARAHRPNRGWAGSSPGSATTVGVSTKVLLGSFLLSNPNIDETVLRTVGQLAVVSDQTAASEQQLGAFGMIVVTDIALAAGAASIPGPVTDIADDGWFLYVPIAQTLLFADSTGLAQSVNYAFDSKAKRVVGDGQSMALMVENASASFVFQVVFTLRLLSQVTGT